MYEALLNFIKAQHNEIGSYPWVFLKVLLETVNNDGIVSVMDAGKGFKSFYRDRFRNGLVTEVKDSPIHRIKRLEDKQAIAIMLKEGYEYLANRGFVSLADEQILISGVLWQDVRQDRMKNEILACVERVLEAYYHKHFGNGCTFCNTDQNEIILENELAFAIKDGYPVIPGHTLVIPKRHFKDIGAATSEEIIALFHLVEEVRKQLEMEEKIDGFNIGFNAGKAAGQSVMHLHIHILPRRWGDAKNPRGGIRNLLKGSEEPTM